MPQAAITIAGITPPAVGKKQGKLADTVGGIWNIWGDKMPGIQMGVTYDIDYTNEEFNGKGYCLIKTINPRGGVQQSAPPVQQRTVAPPMQPMIPQGVQLTARDEQIYVCGLLNYAIGNPGVSPMGLTAEQVVHLTNVFRAAWAETFAKGPYKPVRTPAQSGEELQDSIPF